MDNGTIVGGTVAQTGGATLGLLSGTLNGVAVTGPTGLTVTGTLSVINGISVAAGTISLNRQSNLYLDGTSLTLDNLAVTATGTFTTVYLNGNPSVSGGPGTYTMGPQGTLSGPLTVKDSSYANTLVNDGTINGNSSAGALTIANAYFTNAGLAEATGGGSLFIDAAGWNNSGGTIVAASRGTVDLGGTFTTAGLAINGSGGTVNVTGTANNAGGTLTLTPVTGNLVLSGGTILGGTLAQSGGAALNVSSGTLNGIAVTGATGLTVKGSVHVVNGISVAAGTLNLSGGASVYIDGASQTIDNLAISATATAATLFLNGNTSLTGGYGQTYTIGPNGTLAGPLTVTPYAGTADTLVNQGTINSSGNGGTLNIQSRYFSNQGLAEASAGAVLNISPTGMWNNAGGTIVAAYEGLVNLGGTFTTGGLVINGSAGTIRITGTANNSGGTLAVTPTTGNVMLYGGTILGGTLSGSGGSTLNVSSGTLNGVTVSGPAVAVNVNASLHVVNGISGSAGGTLTLASEGTVYLEGPSQTISGLTLNGTGAGGGALELNASGGSATYTLAPTSTLAGSVTMYDYRYANTLVNQGTINANSSTGQVYVDNAYFGNVGLAEATAGGTLDIAAYSGWNNAAGATLLAGSRSTLVLGGNWSNAGTIAGADATSTIKLGGTFTTAGLGTLTSNGATVQLTGSLNNSGGTLTLNSTTGSVVLLGGTVTGGSVAQTGGATLNVSSGVLSGVTVTGVAGLTVAASGSLEVVNGINVAAGTLNLSGGATLSVDGPSQTIDNLVITSTGAGANLNLNYNQTLTGGQGQTYTLGSHASLAGQLYVNNGYGFNTLVNAGTINTNGENQLDINTSYFTNAGLAEASGGGTLYINAAQSWNNAGGTLVATSGSTLDLGGTFTTAGLAINASAGTVNITGTANNAGSMLAVTPTTGNIVLNTGTIQGGTLTQTGGATLVVYRGTLTGVSLSGSGPVVSAGGFLHVIGGLNGSGGTVSLGLESALLLDGTSETINNVVVAAASQAASVILNDNNTLTSGAAETYTIGANATLAGLLGVSDAFNTSTLLNLGTINANVSSGGALIVGPAYFTNAGLAEATAGGKLTISPTRSWNNAGGSILATGSGSTVALYGTVPNTGTISAASGGTVNLYGTLSGGTVNVSGGTLAEQNGSSLTGSLALQASGSGGLAVLGNANTYTGGTTIANGATVRANSGAGSLGTGVTIVNAGGVLAGTGATGGPVVVFSGGTITAGTGATANDPTGTLTTGAETWNAGALFYAKVNAGTISGSAGDATGDQLVMSGLTVASNGSSPFTVDVVGLGTSPTAFAAGAQLILATVQNGTPGSITSILGDLTLATTNVSFPTGTTGQLAEADVGSDVDLVLVAAPEPTGLLLAAVAVVPLSLGRRRRSGATVV